MRDPVCTADGMVYERTAIAAWLREKDTSPLTGHRLESKILIPQHALRSLIEEWRQAQAQGQARGALGAGGAHLAAGLS